MVTRQHRLMWLGLVAAISTAVGLSAHEVPIHQEITKAALKTLVDWHPKLKSCNAPAIQEILSKAVDDEDAYYTKPMGRFFFHFLPTLNDDINGSAPAHVSASCNSTQWGFSASSICSQSASVAGVPASVLLSPTFVTNSDAFDAAAIRQLASLPTDPNKEIGIRKLGHLLHLLQDLSSPAHASNDAHPHIPNALFSAFGDPSMFELVNAIRSAQGFAVPSEPVISSELDAFNQLHAFTSTNFLSEKAALGLDPAVTPVDSNGYFVLNGRRMARLSPAGFFTIDAHIAGRQFEELVPKAIAYTAALIRYVHENRAPVCEDMMTVTVQGAGTVSSSGDGVRPSNSDRISCGANSTCQHSFPSDKQITLSATPDPGESFVGWNGACSGTNPTVTIDVDQSLQCVATFGVHTQSLRVSTFGPGLVTSDPIPGQAEAINCGSDAQGIPLCEAHYPSGTTVTLRAQGSMFRGWSEPGCPGTAPCIVTMDRDVKAVTADFSGDPVSGVYKLSAINGSGLPAALYPTIQVESGEFRFLDEALWFGPNMSTRHGSVAFTLKGQELGPNGPRPYFSSDSGLGGYTIGEITSNPVPIPFVPNVVLPAGRVIYQWGSQAIPIATISGDTMTVYDRNSAAILTLSKQALIRSAHIDPASSPLNFPNTLQESTSPSRTITITNTGREPLAIQGLVSTTFALNFSVSKVTHAACDLHTILGVGATLPAGASCSIEVTFTPNLSYVTGLRTETITWRTNAGSTSGIVFRGTPVVLEGIATGVPRISVSPPSVTFPPTAIGSVSQQTIMVENVGDVPLRVLSPSSTKFGVDATGCRDRSLPAGGNCSIVLSYQPFFEFTGSLFIPTNSESTGGERFMNLTVPIVATNGRPVADAGPDQLDARVGEFVVVDGSASTDLEGHPLTYAWLVESAPAGSAALLFQTIPQVPTAQFFADRLGTYVLRLLVNDGAQDSLPDTVVVTVQPPPGVTVPSPLGLTFPATPPGSRTTAQTVQITNTGGRPVNITSVDVSGEFGLSSNTCATLSPQAECTLEVYFAPGGSGPRTGEIVILSDASNTVARVLLSGGVFINDPAPPRVTGLGELSLSGSWEVRFYSGDDDESSWFKVGNLPEFEWEEDDSPGRVVRIDFGTDEGVVRIADDNDGDDLRPLTLEPMADGRYLLHLHDDDPPNAIELTLVLQRTP